ncbi:Rrf2 family transcriptional regulator [Phormidium sp. FACHB-592]|uniref:Rrf2 family transcriptional regulator n=1 Tax=Stenomitos frigidus AS-A4 TaxID=2933935 RepID=A0ABV0KML9_9CYAN|nr:Rrf2 family transcriptional regulator [Phormidium sp. FACHB-592]MBD2077050.1 Rrf2 family transcriptional regulator [Phormidium sp. FACHB-592]
MVEPVKQALNRANGRRTSKTPNPPDYDPLDLSSKMEYALIALLELATQTEKQPPLTIGGITAKHGIPDRYLEHILTILRRGGMVQSQRGSRGGYVLAREPWQISLLEVLALIDGARKVREQTPASTSERETIYAFWQQANTVSQTFLGNCTLQDLCQQLSERRQKSPMYYI